MTTISLSLRYSTSFVCSTTADASDARKYSPSPTPRRSGEPRRAPMRRSGWSLKMKQTPKAPLICSCEGAVGGGARGTRANRGGRSGATHGLQGEAYDGIEREAGVLLLHVLNKMRKELRVRLADEHVAEREKGGG